MFLKAIILGIIEGLTEFLPVSSTGHLIIVGEYLKFADERFSNVFNFVIQMGAILAVVLFFRDKLFPKPGNREQSKKVFNLWVKVAVGCIPAGILGFLFDDFMEEHFYNSLAVALALIIGALLLIFAERRLKKVKVSSTEDITYGNALAVGAAQCLAMWPGMSRSASTIIGGLFVGLSREVAAEFSFFLAIPTIVGASGYKLLKAGLDFTPDEWMIMFIGILVSFIVAYIVVAAFMSYIRKRKLEPFAYYRIALGILVLLLV